MRINISNHVFDTEDIRELSIREDRREVFVTTQEDFYRIRYRNERDIADVIYWKSLSNITTKDLHEAMYILVITCDYFINSKEQCNNCPLHKNTKCILSDIPMNWREI